MAGVGGGFSERGVLERIGIEVVGLVGVEPVLGWFDRHVHRGKGHIAEEGLLAALDPGGGFAGDQIGDVALCLD